MQTVKDTIEALIEESFLMMLSEEELERELERFFRTCRSVIRENIRDSGRRRGLMRRIQAIQSVDMGSETESPGLRVPFVRGKKRLPHREDMVRRLIGIKRAAMKAVQELEPQLLFLIEHDLAQPCLHSPSETATPLTTGLPLVRRRLLPAIAFAALAVAAVFALLR